MGPVAALVQQRCADLVAFRRDLHAHPELAREEKRTTQLVAERLEKHGLAVQLLPGTGLLAETGPTASGVLDGQLAAAGRRCGPTSTPCRWTT